MQAKETKLQEIIEGTKQYVVPLFQRTYSWTTKEWTILWNDLLELSDMENPRTHFIGSIVNMPTVSVPEGVSKFMLIDGQQRLTTILIILILLRNKAQEEGNQEFYEEINNTLIVNPYKKNNDFYKLMPTQVDRESFMKLIHQENISECNQITNAYKFFERKYKQTPVKGEKLKKIITTYFSVVSIVLDADDNPYLVFESLNAKGRPLTQADLIRNYFFMRIHVDNQDKVYKEFWQPMQDSLGESLTEFIRHYLMKDGAIVKQADVYYSLKEIVNKGQVVSHLADLSTFSEYYNKLLKPDNEPNQEIKKYLKRLNRIEVSTAYPLLLNIYNHYSLGEIQSSDFVDILKTIENYLIRRFICAIPTNQLNKIFPTVYPQLIANHKDNLAEGLKIVLQSKGYPKDSSFKSSLISSKLYGAADRAIKTKLILETLELSHNHKEQVPFENLTIEHVMPQTLSEWWQEHLGEDWQEVYDLNLHCIGNLTLTAYNSEMSNAPFNDKKSIYFDSHLELNKYFSEIGKWRKHEILHRSEHLANKAIDIWSYFGQDDSDLNQIADVTGTVPTGLWILGQFFKVTSWRDVLEETMNTIADLEPDKFEVIIKQFPNLISRDKNKLRAIRELKNGSFIEVNLSAQAVQRLCYQSIETIELSSEDWKVETL